MSTTIVCAFELMASASAIAGPDPAAYLDSIVRLDEVSVSAIKATSAAQFPSSQTEISHSDIELYDIHDLRGVSEIAPNFYMPRYGSRMTSTIYVRGLGTRIDQPVVAMNVDNVQLLNKDNFDFNFPDIERIEMVRGPQSILYGRNSMGGVINMSTISPLKYQGIKALAEYSSGNSWRASASAYFKPAPTLGIGVVASMNSTDGFYRNRFTGNKVDNERQGLAKLKLSWRPSSRFLLENSAWVALLRQGGYPYEYVETGEINHNDTCFYRRTTVVDGLTLRYFGDSFSVSSITGFQYHKDNMTLDQDFLPQDYFTLTQRRHEWSLTQDFVAKGNVGDYRWLGGLYGFYRLYNMSAPVRFGDYGIAHLIEDNINAALDGALPPAMKGTMQLKWDERSLLLDSHFRSPIWGWAIYHKSECDFGRFTASVGLRLAFERTDFEYSSHVKTSATMYRKVTTPAGTQSVAMGSTPIEVKLADNLHLTSLQLLPEFKLSYRLTDRIAVGAIVSKGYKSGGYNTQIFSDILQQKMMSAGKPSLPRGETPGIEGDRNALSSSGYDPEKAMSYKPETSWNYEMNLEVSIPEASLAFEFSAFWIDCRNQQMTVFPDENSTGRMMSNAGRTRSCGVEIAAAWRPAEALTLRGSYGLADARFRSCDDGKHDYRGNHVPYAPENTLFASASYRWKTPWRFLTYVEPAVSCRGVGRVYWNEENSLSQPFYAQLGASVTFRTPYVGIDLWGENLTGCRFSTFYFESVGHSFLQRGNPRRLGVTLRMNLDF